MKELILGKIPPHFSPNEHQPISPSCFLGAEALYPEWEKLPFVSDPLSDPDLLKKTALEANAYFSSLLEEYADTLNSTNQTELSLKFWKVFLGPWLSHIVHNVLQKYIYVQAFLEKHKAEQFVVHLPPSEIDWNFTNENDFFFRGTLGSYFNEWLYSLIIRSLKPKNLELCTAPLKEINIPTQQPRSASFIKKLQYRVRCPELAGAGMFFRVILSLVLSLKRPIQEPPFVQNTTTVKSDSLLQVMSCVAALSTPKAFKQISLPSQSFTKGKIRLAGTSLTGSDEIARLNYAYAYENGEVLLPSQHGCYYGTADCDDFRGALEYTFGHFISWGWTHSSYSRQYKMSIIPLPSPKLSRGEPFFLPKRRKRILMIGASTHSSDLRIESRPRMEQLLKYRQDKLSFMQGLSQKNLECFTYKPYFISGDGFLGDANYIRKNAPHIKIESNQSLGSLIKTTKIAILDHPGTSFYEMLAANIPTIGYWDPKSWKMNKESEASFMPLHECNILFSSPKDAADFLNKSVPDINHWWKSPEVQRARKLWCHQFARHKKLWLPAWIKALTGIKGPKTL